MEKANKDSVNLKEFAAQKFIAGINIKMKCEENRITILDLKHFCNKRCKTKTKKPSHTRVWTTVQYKIEFTTDMPGMETEKIVNYFSKQKLCLSTGFSDM